MSEELMSFDLPQEVISIIKVIGIGGGGSNAVNHMFRQGIKDVNFVVCNTDAQALEKSAVPVKIQLGASLTEGRGAGNKPDVGRQAAIENLNDVTEVLENSTKMVFITAGMGGGTGTGAAPVIAKAAKDMGILTVAIVTIPFRFEGTRRINQALEGINELKEHVDSLLVINNEKLREIYGDLTFTEAFAKADNVLTIAAKGIAEIITVPGILNVDFADVQTIMTDSGISIMGSASAEGEGRALNAIMEALTSPLLNNNDISGTRNILLNITSGTEEITMDEIGEITDYVQESAGKNADIIWGHCIDESLGRKINVTIIATGFGSESIPELLARSLKEKKFNNLEEGRRKFILDMDKKESVLKQEKHPVVEKGNKITYEDLYEKELNSAKAEELDEKAVERMEQLKRSYDKLKEMSNLSSPKNISELENTPAYKRMNIEIEDTRHSQNSDVSRYSLSEDEDKNARLSENNTYLHDNVD
ncbi:MAG: cell division protein FtsZ [Bacteroidetes bacterium]|nr:cell division protein FtsZ [Bacteroidota bacterium]